MDTTLSAFITAHQKRKTLTPQTTEYLAELLANRPRDFIPRATSMHYGEQAKIANWRFPASFVQAHKEIEITNIADVQFGHKDCKVPALRELVKSIAEKPNAFVVLCGDIIDAANAFTPGTPFDNLFASDSQVMHAVEVLMPIRNKILGYVGGNHERRGIGSFGDLGTWIATLLGVPYSAGRQYVRIYFGKHDPFIVLLWHGHPRARTKGALGQIINRFMTEIGVADLYLTGHNHQGLIVPGFREVVVDGSIKLKRYVGASGTSFLETYGSYGEWMGFGAYEALMVRTTIESNGKWSVHVP